MYMNSIKNSDTFDLSKTREGSLEQFFSDNTKNEKTQNEYPNKFVPIKFLRDMGIFKFIILNSILLIFKITELFTHLILLTISQFLIVVYLIQKYAGSITCQ